MIDLRKDRKSNTFVVTKTDKEGFCRQINLTADELDKLVILWKDLVLQEFSRNCRN